MKKLTKLLMILLLLISLVGCGGNKDNTEDVPQQDQQQEEVVEARTAIIFEMASDAKVSVKREGEDEDAYEGMRLFDGDVITTALGSTVYVRIDDDKNILLAEDSVLKISEMKTGKLVLSLDKGQLFFDVENKLGDDEEMSFNAGGTTMSIRGTSGIVTVIKQLEQFLIIEGKGYISSETHELVLGTNNKLEKDKDGNDTLSPVDVADLIDAFYNYVKEHPEYNEKLEKEGWKQDDDNNNTVPPENTIINYEQYGWHQLADGTWVFSEEDAKNSVESTEYKEPAKPANNPQTNTTAQTTQSASTSTSTDVPDTPPVTDPDTTCPGCGTTVKTSQLMTCAHCSGKYCSNCAAQHTQLNSATAMSAISAKLGEDAVETFKENGASVLSGNYYLCDLGDYTINDLYPYAILSSTAATNYIGQYFETRFSPFCSVHCIKDIGSLPGISDLALDKHTVKYNCVNCQAECFECLGCHECEQCHDVYYCNTCLSSIPSLLTVCPGCGKYLCGICSKSESHVKCANETCTKYICSTSVSEYWENCDYCGQYCPDHSNDHVICFYCGVKKCQNTLTSVYHKLVVNIDEVLSYTPYCCANCAQENNLESFTDENQEIWYGPGSGA